MNTKIKPDWAGEGLLSQFVNFLIKTKPIYNLMKHQARQVLIKTAEKKDISWRKNYEELEASGIKQQLSTVVNSNIVYPDYYKVPFHAYPEGNLCWQAAFEANSATYSMALRVWPKENLTWLAAHERLRGSFHNVLATYVTHPVHDILDIGCSVGISTLTIHRYYQKNQASPVCTVGLDLSPYMLTVAKSLDTNGEICKWIHAQAENTGEPSNTFDLVTLQFVIHELPRNISKEIFAEALRLLRPGGCIAIVDNNPKSPVIQNLPPILFTLMKSTEPWSDDYYSFDIETALEDVGFEKAITIASDPRHRTIISQKPLPRLNKTGIKESTYVSENCHTSM
ncbi:MAG: class I SAM-dependent methyltransferase [Rhizonema sp. PD38]|nr:class I SAM-dependent methyltransferase [Rhizonema sp. PD38]